MDKEPIVRRDHDRNLAHDVRDPDVMLEYIRFEDAELNDRPLAGRPHAARPFHWRLYVCESVATAIMMAVGLATNIVLMAPASPLHGWLAPYPLVLFMLGGLLFGGAGTVAAMTRFGHVSGAHLSPSITLAFTLARKLAPIDAAGYCLAQIVGACAGVSLLAALGILWPSWGSMLASLHFGATLPGLSVSTGGALACEICVTLGLVIFVYWMASRRALQFLAPWAGAFYFCVLNPISAWISGNSTNFARSLAPALFDRNLSVLWVYLIGPLIGSACAVALIEINLLGRKRLSEARVVNFGHHGRVPRLAAPHAVGPPPEQVGT